MKAFTSIGGVDILHMNNKIGARAELIKRKILLIIIVYELVGIRLAYLIPK